MNPLNPRYVTLLWEHTCTFAPVATHAQLIVQSNPHLHLSLWTCWDIESCVAASSMPSLCSLSQVAIKCVQYRACTCRARLDSVTAVPALLHEKCTYTGGSSNQNVGLAQRWTPVARLLALRKEAWVWRWWNNQSGSVLASSISYCLPGSKARHLASQ